ncbi:MAG: transcription elongation factor GreAB [Motiliproteus sp.]
MNKASLVTQIIEQLNQQLDTLLQASDQAHQSATHSENRAENKYDTLGLEAAYLAHGLSIRAQELQQTITALGHWAIPDYQHSDAIGLGALVTIDTPSGQQKQVLLAAQGGGLKCYQGKDPTVQTVTVVTPATPLGTALTGRFVGDEISLQIAGSTIHYSIVDLV